MGAPRSTKSFVPGVGQAGFRGFRGRVPLSSTDMINLHHSVLVVLEGHAGAETNKRLWSLSADRSRVLSRSAQKICWSWAIGPT